MGDPPDTGSEGDAPNGDGGTGGTAQPAIPAGARCGRHPDIEAHGTCSRCGNFMCRMCSGDGASATCVTCLERGAGGSFPLTRDGYSLDSLFNYCIARFKEHWVTLCVATLILFAVIFGMHFVTQILLAVAVGSGAAEDSPFGTFMALQLSSSLIQMVVQIWIQMGLVAVCLDVLEGRAVDLTRLFSQADKILGAVVVSLIYNLSGLLFFLPVIGLMFYFLFDLDLSLFDSPEQMLEVAREFPWIELGGATLLLSIPYTYVLLGLTYAVPVMIHHDCGPIDGMRRAWGLARGKRMSMLGVLTVAIIIACAGLLACCVGALATVPAATLLFTALYLALDNDPRAAR